MGLARLSEGDISVPERVATMASQHTQLLNQVNRASGGGLTRAEWSLPVR